ncbi:MAG: hypothetical protein FWF97_02590 [Alphaproteobacteria bacterium]|nr:hypothetical protein [Alphaproteobacteria bacterium]
MTKLIYLQGADSSVGQEDLIIDKDAADRVKFIRRLAGGKENVISFNAPHSSLDHPGKFSWFQNPVGKYKDRDPRLVMAEIQQSAEFIKKEISRRKLKKFILCGASQGGFMALWLVLNDIIKPEKAVAIVPFYSREFLHAGMNKTTPILWAAAGKDIEIPPNVADTWKYIRSMEAHLDYICDFDSLHGKWTPNFKKMIMEWVKKDRGQY